MLIVWLNFFIYFRFTRQDYGEDVNAGASTSHNISGGDSTEVSPIKKPTKMEPASITTTKMEIVDEDVLNISDDVVLIPDDNNVNDFFDEIHRNINAMPANELENDLFQIESVESLHPSVAPFMFDDSQIVIDDSL